MINTTRYIEWRLSKNKSLEAQVAEVIKHWETRYELGSAILLCKNPEAALKLAEKQWRKLTRQAQKHREAKAAAEDILQITRTISRMQRVRFSAKNPSDDPDAKFYVVSNSSLHSLPSHCYTLYAADSLPDVSLLKVLPADALIVAYGSKAELAGIHSKSVLEERLLTEEAEITKWLQKSAIDLNDLPRDINKANEALDTLLGSNSLQAEFLHRAKAYLHLVQLAQPVSLTTAQKERLKSLQQLEHHVRVLSPAFLSDHIVDSQSDDSFLLRELSAKKILTLESLKQFISQQYDLGRIHLAAALEQKAGFVRL